MLLKIVAGTALLLVAAFFILGFNAVGIAAIVTAGGCFLAALFLQPKQHKGPETDNAELESIKEERDRLLERIEHLNGKIEESQKELVKQEEDSISTYKQVITFIEAVPIAEKLTGIVIDKSESSTSKVTDTIFSIAETSNKVGLRIQELLTGLFNGEHSLQNILSSLSQEIEGMRNLIADFQQLSRNYHEDMRKIEKAIKDIEQFTSNITDLADRTNLLAINASIEAARVGNQGKGFAVIAGEVQELSGNSKKIAEEINSLIKSTEETVDASFARQSVHIEEAVASIRKSQTTLNDTSSYLSGQLQAVEVSVEESKKLSGSVTEGLNDIIHSQQYQDITRQVLEHLVALFSELETELKQTTATGLAHIEINREEIENDIKQRAKRYFTVREEWLALDLPLEEKIAAGEDETAGESKKELKGDITLF